MWSRGPARAWRLRRRPSLVRLANARELFKESACQATRDVAIARVRRYARTRRNDGRRAPGFAHKQRFGDSQKLHKRRRFFLVFFSIRKRLTWTTTGISAKGYDGRS
eukprot:30626-Pelagococcus_subviridis.AAC.12